MATDPESSTVLRKVLLAGVALVAVFLILSQTACASSSSRYCGDYRRVGTEYRFDPNNGDYNRVDGNYVRANCSSNRSGGSGGSGGGAWFIGGGGNRTDGGDSGNRTNDGGGSSYRGGGPGSGK